MKTLRTPRKYGAHRPTKASAPFNQLTQDICVIASLALFAFLVTFAEPLMDAVTKNPLLLMALLAILGVLAYGVIVTSEPHSYY